MGLANLSPTIRKGYISGFRASHGWVISVDVTGGSAPSAEEYEDDTVVDDGGAWNGRLHRGLEYCDGTQPLQHSEHDSGLAAPRAELHSLRMTYDPLSIENSIILHESLVFRHQHHYLTSLKPGGNSKRNAKVIEFLENATSIDMI